jgi:hypothetical protein
MAEVEIVRVDCMRGTQVVCVRRVGPFVWWEAQPFVYKYVLLPFALIE